MKCYFSELISPRQNALFKRRHIGDCSFFYFNIKNGNKRYAHSTVTTQE